MNKPLCAFLSVLAIIVAPISAVAQSLPITVGMNYGVARQRLIQAGWQPAIPRGVHKIWAEETTESDIRIQKANANAFRMRGWYETLGCAPTGPGTCDHLFTDRRGRRLIVETGSGGYSHVPDVRRFYYDADTR